jgi:NADP-dependent 3-hydroxy acid dehydrogenase YdfG
MQQLTDRKAVVSGGSSGIGRAVVQQLAAAGASVAIADVHAAAGLPAGVHAYACDVASAEQVALLQAQVQVQLGQPDVLVCSAGQGVHEKLTEGDPEKWRRVIDTNLLGALRLVRAFVPGMVAQGRGDVVFVSSVAAGKPHPYGGVYAATKTALDVVADTLRQEVLPAVRVTVVSPGVTDTDFFRNTLSGLRSAADIGFGALAPDDVARAVLLALEQPPEVSLNQLTIRPSTQPF